MKIGKESKTLFTLKAVFDSKTLDKNIIKNQNSVTEFVEKQEAVIYLGKELTIGSMKAAANVIVALKRGYQIDVKSFVSKKVSEAEVVRILVETNHLVNGEIYSIKTAKKPAKINMTLVNVSKEGKDAFKKADIFGKAMTYTRDLQICPPNVLNSETYAKRVQNDFKNLKNIKVKVLNKKQITELGMGLLLSVNKGSAFEPKVVIMEYTGNPKSKDKTAIIGKGITFDAGGYNIKVGPHQKNMKFDMSGSASVVGAMMAINDLKPKSNVAGIIVLTDNMINSVASTPDSVFTAMNGKTVEINNTDAEGRLAMADGLTYAAKKLGATRLVDIATLTGAVLVSLGHTYSGIFTESTKAWKDVEKAAERADELVWRLPMHEDFGKFIKGSLVADMYNTDLTGMGGSSSAAMFLKEFTEGKEYIHIDIAGSASVGAKPLGVGVKTLVEIVNG